MIRLMTKFALGFAALAVLLAIDHSPVRATGTKDDPKDYRVLGADKKRVAIVNAKGEIETVRYSAINVMLLNEFLKEHKAFVAEQEKVKNLEAGMAGLLATVKEQATQIQKVSAQLELRKPIQTLARNLP